MFSFGVLSTCVAIAVCSAIISFRVGIGAPSLRIVTNPRQGPFRLGQTVEFTCEVDLAPSENLIYQWRTVDRIYSSTYSGRSFNKTFYDNTLRFCWYFCSVTHNQTLLGKANKLFEVHGLLYTEDSVTRAFLLNGYMALRINNLSTGYYGYRARYISYLSWYHNGTKIFPNDRVNIINNGTTLVISNMMESDAGKYEIKIGSIDYYGYTSSLCDENLLPVLETLAIHAPVTFYVQQYYINQYKPEDVVNYYYLPTYSNNLQHSIILNHSIDIDTNVAFRRYRLPLSSYLYKDGVSQSLNTGMYNLTRFYGNEIMLSQKISYNSSEDVIGHYIYTEYIYYRNINSNFCPIYYRYYRNNYHYYGSSAFVLYWTVQEYESPVLSLHIEKLVITTESNRMECVIVEGQPATLSLWHYNELLIEAYGIHLNYMTKPYQFGIFTCKADNVSNSSLVRERGRLQVLLDVSCCSTIKMQNKNTIVSDLQRGLSDVMNIICEDCNITSSHFKQNVLNYSVSGQFLFFATDLIFSNLKGSLTSITLINRFQSWILSENTPMLTIAGHVLPLTKDCPTYANSVSRTTCLKLFNSSMLKATSVMNSPIVGIVFVAGLLAGGIAATVIVILVVICKRKYSSSPQQNNLNESGESDKGKDIPMDSNQAYETVDLHYEDPHSHRMTECIYEQPVC